MSSRRGPVAAFLFSSGACALVYQVVWTRELRLVFGASTGASAAVLAIFIGGLGVGGMVLGKRADNAERPLELYANLEALVAVSAAATPLLLALVRRVYLAAGGAAALGATGGTLLRLALALVVLGVPTCLMGGTLPAAIRAAQADDDVGRRDAALLYGANTCGAVLGALATTFVLLEVFGTQLTLWLACTLNLLVAMIARPIARTPAYVRPPADVPVEGVREAVDVPPAPAPFVLFAAGAAGFAFFLMELVWYRMLAPLLGGSHFTFGLILAVALVGIGTGGIAYALMGKNRPATLEAFAITSLLEALLLIVPFALGDRLAILAIALRPLGSLGFLATVLGWTTVAAIVIVPAAFASGVQFPLLIALLGRGRASVGRQVGMTYAWNTVGAIAGSLAGGFGMVPLLGALGSWKLVCGVLVALGLAAAVLAVKSSKRPLALAWPLVIAGATLLALRADGPSAAWRHAPIGAGRVPAGTLASPVALLTWLESQRRAVVWEKDGVESAVALRRANDVEFVVSGKVDGALRSDAGTQVMAGVVGACLHGSARTAYVIGLGTGSSAGWLADVQGIERVDVAEIEPAILEVARRSASVNRDVLSNPRVRVKLHDAREGLLTSRERWDLVVSEPSNPYRAGISSLFTREYYEAVAARLAPGGLFLQWVQAYEIDAQTLRSVYATIGDVMPHVETWELADNDLLLVASREPRSIDVAALRRCVESPVVREGMLSAWQTEGVEGFLSHHVARASFGEYQRTLHGGASLNTDDLNPLEFGMARRVGTSGILARDVVHAARRRRELHPDTKGGDVDWNRVEDEAMSAWARPDANGSFTGKPNVERATRADALAAYNGGDAQRARFLWRQQHAAPATVVERLRMADAFASTGDEQARVFLAPLASRRPVETAIVETRLAMLRGDEGATVANAESVLQGLRASPWGDQLVVERGLSMIAMVARRWPATAARLFDAAKEPFSSGLFDWSRQSLMLELSRVAGYDERCVTVLAGAEPHPAPSLEMYRARVACYTATGHPLKGRAEDDLMRWERMSAGAVDPRAE